MVAPTGSGKTLAGFLWALDDLVRNPPDASAPLRIVYVSPLKRWWPDIERNLRAPLSGIQAAAARLEQPAVDIRTASSSPRSIFGPRCARETLLRGSEDASPRIPPSS